MAERSQTRMIVLIVVLAILLAAVLVIQSGGFSGNGAATNAPASTGDAAGEPDESSPIRVQTAWKRPEAVGPIARDPMRIDIQKALSEDKRANKKSDDSSRMQEEPQFLATGIVYNADQPSSVIIDGYILHEGDTIHGATVEKITEQYAELRHGDKKWKVRPGQTNPEP